jgi:hypothetical protein
MDRGDRGRDASRSTCTLWLMHGRRRRRREVANAAGIQSQAGTAIRAHQSQREAARREHRPGKEIAARTVNKERARSGEAKTASPTSTMDMSSSQRGGQRSHRGAQSPTYAQLYSEARSRGVKGRSSMDKAQLARALGR